MGCGDGQFYLANHGPLVVGFMVYEDFDKYGGGVYRHVTGKKRGGHCVLVVGYDDNLQAWICRNSWGTGFGGATHPDGTGGGFFMIGYGDSDISDTMYGCHGVRVPTGSRLAQRVGDMDGDGQAEFLVQPVGNRRAQAVGRDDDRADDGTERDAVQRVAAQHQRQLVRRDRGLLRHGRAEVFVVSPWGVGVLGLSGGTLAAVAMAPNGSHLGSWVLDTAADEYGPVGDLDGDGKAEIVVRNASGIGVLKVVDGAIGSVMTATNGTRFGQWLLNSGDNVFSLAADLDGDGRAELVVASPWGLGILKLAGGSFTAPMMAPNGTRFGQWLLNTGDNTFGPVADFDGDGRAEVLVTSPWCLGVLKLSGSTMAAPMMAPNGTRLGGWLLNTADNRIGRGGRGPGGPGERLLFTSPWGIGLLQMTGSTLSPLMMAQNGTRFGGWLLNRADNEF